MEINIGDVELKKRINIGNVEVGVKKIFPELENLEVTPSLQQQTFKSNMYGYNIVNVKEIQGKELTVIPTMEEQVNEGVYTKVTTKGIESEELTVIPSTEQQIFDGLYNKVTVEGADINTGETSTGIKQFSTEEEMQANTNAKEGDLAVVYGEQLQDLIVGNSYTEIYCPPQIVFDAQRTSTTNIYLMGNMYRLVVTSTKIYFGRSMTALDTVTYSSSDGITYTRTDSNAEIMTIAEIYNNRITSITVPSANYATLKQMFKAKSIYFGGLYKYGSTGYFIAPNQLTIKSKNVYEETFYGPNGLEEGTMQNVSDLSVSDLKEKIIIWNTLNEMTTSQTNFMNAFSNTTIKSLPKIDTSKVTIFQVMCYSCSNLVDVPLLDTTSATTMFSAFKYCPKLSEESLNNILLMCVNVSSEYSSTKTLADVGLTEEQATICTGLSNYQAFLDAGWTMGY